MSDAEPGPRPRELARFEQRPHRTLVGLSLPIMLSLVAEPLTGLVDTAFVAALGDAPLAALGVGTVLLSSTVWVFNFLGIGTQTEVAHALGAREPERARDAATTALALAAGIGVAMALAMWPALGALVRALGAEGEIASAAITYLEIRLLAIPALLLTLATFGALRGVHDMRTPFWIAVGSNALNAVLDAVWIHGFGPMPAFGIAGAAWASVVSQWLGAAFAVGATWRALGRSPRVELARARNLLVVGRDLFLRTGLLLLFLLLTTRAATRIGADAGAAHQVIRQFWLLTALALDAFAAAAQSLVGSFLGAGRPDGARRAAAVGVQWSVGAGIAIAAGMLAAEPLASALLASAGAAGLLQQSWWIAAVAQPLNAVSFATDGIHWGTRDYRYLRNVMGLASAAGAALLLGLEAREAASLVAIWWIMALWIAVRAGLGLLRIWPGIGRAPLRATHARVGASQDSP